MNNKSKDYFNRNYIDIDSINKDIKIETKKVLSMKEIFIIVKPTISINVNVEFVTNDPKKMLSFIRGKKEIKLYDISYLEFLKNIHKDTCKWRTYKKLQVFKYHNTLKLTKPNSKFRLKLDNLKDDILVKRYLRELKLERILNER